MFLRVGKCSGRANSIVISIGIVEFFKQTFTMKKNIISSYSAPMVDMFEVVAERGYSVSEPLPGGTGATLPGFGSEEDSLTY